MGNMQGQCASNQWRVSWWSCQNSPLRHDIPSGGNKSRQSEQTLHGIWKRFLGILFLLIFFSRAWSGALHHGRTNWSFGGKSYQTPVPRHDKKHLCWLSSSFGIYAMWQEANGRHSKSGGQQRAQVFRACRSTGTRLSKWPLLL